MAPDPQKVIALIPARGGSKGVPRKNIHPLGGKPLIGWTIAAAQEAKCIGRIIVSTEDPEIAATARKLGAEVPFMRPAALAEDATADLPVCEHVLRGLDAMGDLPEIVVWLRPTAPLRLASDIDCAFDTLDGSDSVRSVSQPKAHPYWMKTISSGRLHAYVPGNDERNFTNRQMLPPVYMLNGSVDIMRTRNVLGRGDLWGDIVAAYVMPQERSVDIDAPMDIAIAEALLRAAGRL